MVAHTELPALVQLQHLPREYRSAIDPGISTGWACLDRYLQGLRSGEVTVITADTGVGKTTFCTQLMMNAAMQGVPVWLNSWEMKPAAIVRKVASLVLRKLMKLRKFSDEENKQLDEWSAKYRMYINPQTMRTNLRTLRQELLAAKDLSVRVVMLDHLDYLVVSQKDKQHEAIEETVKTLHEMAFELEMHFLLICHPRQIATASEEVGIHSLKGSSAIKQYADNVVILHRCSRTDKQSDPGKVKVTVAKNRMFGTEGCTYLFYQPEWDGYLDMRGT